MFSLAFPFMHEGQWQVSNHESTNDSLQVDLDDYQSVCMFNERFGLTITLPEK
jgi:hypothetical protein